MSGSGGGRDLDFLCRDLEIPLWVEKRSRHEIDVATFGSLREVATWIFGVATWLGAGQEKRCRDPVLRSRPGLSLWPSQRDFNVATWASGCRKDPCRDIILR